MTFHDRKMTFNEIHFMLGSKYMNVVFFWVAYFVGFKFILKSYGARFGSFCHANQAESNLSFSRRSLRDNPRLVTSLTFKNARNMRSTVVSISYLY